MEGVGGVFRQAFVWYLHLLHLLPHEGVGGAVALGRDLYGIYTFYTIYTFYHGGGGGCSHTSFYGIYTFYTFCTTISVNSVNSVNNIWDPHGTPDYKCTHITAGYGQINHTP